MDMTVKKMLAIKVFELLFVITGAEENSTRNRSKTIEFH
jgi:hypothetical protein